jgi:hypothetical protein
MAQCAVITETKLAKCVWTTVSPFLTRNICVYRNSPMYIECGARSIIAQVESRKNAKKSLKILPPNCALLSQIRAAVEVFFQLVRARGSLINTTYTHSGCQIALSEYDRIPNSTSNVNKYLLLRLCKSVWKCAHVVVWGEGAWVMVCSVRGRWVLLQCAVCCSYVWIRVEPPPPPVVWVPGMCLEVNKNFNCGWIIEKPFYDS